MSLARQHLAGVGNKDFGYIAGGSPGPTTIGSINYAKMTLQQHQKEVIWQINLSSTTESSTYVGGGYAGVPVSKVDRIDSNHGNSRF